MSGNNKAMNEDEDIYNIIIFPLDHIFDIHFLLNLRY
jgi:hypothetical protein